MTLDQYLTKNGCTRSSIGSVLLTRDQYRYWAQFYGKEFHYTVEVLVFNCTYRLHKESGILYTMDDNGNFNKPSVFKIDYDNDLNPLI